jgi:hypothetical protein
MCYASTVQFPRYGRERKTQQQQNTEAVLTYRLYELLVTLAELSP